MLKDEDIVKLSYWHNTVCGVDSSWIDDLTESRCWTISIDPTKFSYGERMSQLVAGRVCRQSTAAHMALGPRTFGGYGAHWALMSWWVICEWSKLKALEQDLTIGGERAEEVGDRPDLTMSM